VPVFKMYCPLTSTSDLNVQICTAFADDDKVFAVMGNLTDAAREITLTTRFAGRGLHRRDAVSARVMLHPGANRVELRARLRGTRAWYPAEHPTLGGPVMYTAATTVVDGAHDSDTRTDR